MAVLAGLGSFVELKKFKKVVLVVVQRKTGSLLLFGVMGMCEGEKEDTESRVPDIYTLAVQEP